MSNSFEMQMCFLPAETPKVKYDCIRFELRNTQLDFDDGFCMKRVPLFAQLLKLNDFENLRMA